MHSESNKTLYRQAHERIRLPAENRPGYNWKNAVYHSEQIANDTHNLSH
jgi:hypothetical protein